MNKPTKSEITPGLLLNSTVKGEVMVLAVPEAKGAVKVEAFDERGEPYSTYVPMSSLRWQ